jgi:hypothetical protein
MSVDFIEKHLKQFSYAREGLFCTKRMHIPNSELVQQRDEYPLTLVHLDTAAEDFFILVFQLLTLPRCEHDFVQICFQTLHSLILNRLYHILLTLLRMTLVLNEPLIVEIGHLSLIKLRELLQVLFVILH